MAGYVKRIREYSMPLFQAQAAKGNLTSVKLYRLRYPHPNAEGQAYQFVLITEVPRFQDLDFPAYFIDPKTVLGETKAAEMPKAAAASPSKLVRVEEFRILESTKGWSKADSKVLHVRYLKANPGMEGDLLKRQTEFWKPYWEDTTAAGVTTGWAALQIRFRNSEDLPYQYINMNGLSKFGSMDDQPAALMEKWGDKIRQLNMRAERKLIREELWQLVESAR
jgi:hypothetical protein